MGFAGDEPHVARAGPAQHGRGQEALRGQFLAWANDPALKRILVSHGETIEEDPHAALRTVADALA